MYRNEDVSRKYVIEVMYSRGKYIQIEHNKRPQYLALPQWNLKGTIISIVRRARTNTNWLRGGHDIPGSNKHSATGTCTAPRM